MPPTVPLGVHFRSSPWVRRLHIVEEVDALPIGDLSDFFNPFLRRFSRDALSAGGEVFVSPAHGESRGLYTVDPVERVAAIFTREREIAETFFVLHDNLSVYSDFPLASAAETFDVLALEVPNWSPTHRFAHPVRMATAEDRPRLLQLLSELYGRIEESWLQAMPRDDEPCFVVEVGSELAGAGWASVVDGHARLHTLSVRPTYRRLGIGADLWHARILWSREVGAESVICEISTRNLPSRRIALSGGMRPVGRIYRSQRR
jgi:GNAT superfamily N-acetyltransferase